MRQIIFALLVGVMTLCATTDPASANSDAWVNEPGGTAACTFPAFRACWWDNLEATSADVTTVLDTTVCENITASCFSSLTTTNHNNTCTIYDNGNGFTISATDLTAEIVKDAVLDGDPAVDLFSIYGFDAAYTYARFAMTDVGTTTRLKMHCHPRVK